LIITRTKGHAIRTKVLYMSILSLTQSGHYKGHANNLLANAKGPRNKNKSSPWSNISRAMQIIG